LEATSKTKGDGADEDCDLAAKLVSAESGNGSTAERAASKDLAASQHSRTSEKD
jgi:hypothetical protein